jgi:hypothetical protein
MSAARRARVSTKKAGILDLGHPLFDAITSLGFVAVLFQPAWANAQCCVRPLAFWTFHKTAMVKFFLVLAHRAGAASGALIENLIQAARVQTTLLIESPVPAASGLE